MRNKIVATVVIISIIVWVVFEILKSFPDLDLKYHMVFLSTQITVSLIAFAITLFTVFGYSLLTYAISFFAYLSLYSMVWRVMQVYHGSMPIIGTNRLVMYVVVLVLTFLTFYILKKCRVNLNTSSQVTKKDI